MWALTRMNRWRMRDWALSFLACGFTLDVEPETLCSSPNQVSVRTTVSQKKENCRRNQTDRKSARANKTSKSEKKPGKDSRGKAADKSRRTRFADDDFIVFCFREDGAFDVVKSRASDVGDSRLHRKKKKNLKQRRRGEDAREVHSNTRAGDHPNEDHPAKGDEKHVLSDHENKVEEERTIYIDTDEPRRGERAEDGGRTVSVESIGSNRSDGSDTSFAFPVLRWEWAGSPAKMPRAQNLPQRKHEPRCVDLQCCGF